MQQLPVRKYLRTYFRDGKGNGFHCKCQSITLFINEYTAKQAIKPIILIQKTKNHLNSLDFLFLWQTSRAIPSNLL
jgi:hypothetical protein